VRTPTQSNLSLKEIRPGREGNSKEKVGIKTNTAGQLRKDLQVSKSRVVLGMGKKWIHFTLGRRIQPDEKKGTKPKRITSATQLKRGSQGRYAEP